MTSRQFGMPKSLSSHSIRQLSSGKSCTCTCASPPISRRILRPRNFHTASPLRSQYTPQQPAHPQERPRWAQTPPLMTAPYRMKPLPEGNDFPVNEDPAKLDHVYNRLLGDGGDKMLTEEVKWLAVTHKSFDHGRRGYNDRLSLIGTHPNPTTHPYMTGEKLILGAVQAE